MKETIWLILNILRINFKKKVNYLVFLGMPLAGLLIAFLAYGGSSETTLHIGVVAKDKHTITENTIAFMENLNHVEVTSITASEVEQSIIDGTLDAVVIFEDGFAESIQSGEPNHIEITSLKGAQVTSFITAYLYNYIDNVTAISKVADGNEEVFDALYQQAYHQPALTLQTNVLQDTTRQNNMTYQSIGFLIMIMLLTAGSLTEIILKEKESRTYFRLLSAPINAKQYVLANIIMSLMAVTVQIFVVIFMMKVFQFESGIPWWEMAFVLFMFALVAVGASLLTVAFSNTSASVGAIQSALFVPTCLLAGSFWPIGIMPNILQRVADFLPQRWVLGTIEQLQKGVSLSSLYLNLLILLAFAAAFFLIAIYKFSKNNNVRNFI